MFLSQKAQQITDCYKSVRGTFTDEQKKLFDAMLSLVTEVSSQIDMLDLKVEELSEDTEKNTCNLESINSNLSTIKDRIVGEIRVDTDSYMSGNDEDHDHDGCECGDDDCDGNCGCTDDLDSVTLQCSECEELFIVSGKDASKGIVECPFCNKFVNVRDCLID